MKPEFYCAECGEAIEGERGLCEACEREAQDRISAVHDIKADVDGGDATNAD